ncbi:HIT family protein [Methanocella sp. MCL-LM]|uniref:HIT family protein n=1 Tax=Methanocella sp. MCL-LM TaxID=3412035 RepID=UPI003C724717
MPRTAPEVTMEHSNRDGLAGECFTRDVADMIAAGVLRRSHAMARPFQVNYDSHCSFCRKNRLIVLVNEEYEHPEPTFIRRLPVSVAALSYDQTYPGRSVVILRDHVTDLNDLMKHKQMLYMAFMEDVSATVDAIKAVCNPDRMNYAIYMNQNEHLHVHLIPRYKREGEAYHDPPPFRGVTKMFPDFDYRSLAVRIRRQLKCEQSELSRYCEQLINDGLPP